MSGQVRTAEQAERKRQQDRDRQRRLYAAGAVKPLTAEQKARKAQRNREYDLWNRAYRHYLDWCRREGWT